MLQRYWYSKNPLAFALWPLSLLFRSVAGARRWAYQRGFLTRWRSPVPVVVVGNINVGGTGKTPLVAYLFHALRKAGWKPGIVSRGYGGQSTTWPQPVYPHSDPRQVGDEPVLLAQQLQSLPIRCPIVVAPDRVAAVKQLLHDGDCDIVISDDGLQHYPLQRQIEIVVIDATRIIGNGFCLPAGPLREPASRLQSVDCLVINGIAEASRLAPLILPPHYTMTLHGKIAINLADPSQTRTLSSFHSQTVHAVAAIGHPERFFALLRDQAIHLIEHPFADHYPFTSGSFDFGDDKPVLMTAKDAVKCRAFAAKHWWYVPVNATLEPGFFNHLAQLLEPHNG